MEPANSKKWHEGMKAIETSRWFQTSIIFIIVVAALTVGARTYSLPASIDWVINYLDIAITIFFFIEITLRFIVCQEKRNFLKDPWNLFDSVIIFASILPVSEADMFLVARLLRVFRVLRLISIVPDLRSLINALLTAIPKMGYIALLMFIIFYIFGAFGAIFFHHVNPVLWGDIATAMLTLFRVATFEDWTDVMYETMEVYPLSWAFYIVFIFLTAFVFLNMMVGVVLDVMMQETAKEEHESQENYQTELMAQIHSLQEQIQKLSEKIDKK
ncbi:ion transporter [Marinomonas agarivorans]|nr:ion transporter [Marinomonas agarivorans]